MRAAGKRGKILEAALELFAVQGVDGVPVPRIAELADVAVGTLYRYYPSKEAIAAGVLDACQAQFDAAVLAPLPATASPRAAFRLYWRRMAGFARSVPLAHRYLDQHGTATGANAFVVAIRDLVAWGRREGAIKALDPLLVVALLQGALSGLFRNADHGGAVAQSLVEDMEDCLWNAVAAR